MPGPYIHISAMKHIGRQLTIGKRPFVPARSGRINPNWTGPNTADLGRIMQLHPNFASLGAIGPDLFFFLPDFRNESGINTSSVLKTVLDFLEELYSTLDPFIAKWEKYVGPISEDTAEEMSRLTGGLSEVVGDIAGELKSILWTALEGWLTEQRDWFGFFSLGLDQGLDEQAFFWSDMLHYRETGQFARAIWRNADDKNDDALRAYALGYNTHLATDVTGHAFVNVISGGPFRMHWQRHHLVENHMDSLWYLRDVMSPRSGDNYSQLTESALYFDIAFDGDDNAVHLRPPYPTGGTLRDGYVRRRVLDIDSALPESLIELILKSMSDVWDKNPQRPKILPGDGRPDAKAVAEAYDLFFRYLKLVSVDGFAHEPPDPPDIFPNLDFPTMSDPAGDDPPGDDDGGSFWDDLLDFLLSLFRLLAYIVEVAVYLATLPWAVLADIVTYPIRLGLYYALELPLFYLLKSFRSILVMTGYMLPMDDEISSALTHIGNSPFGSFMDVVAQLGDVFGGLLPTDTSNPNESFRDLEYPHSIVFDGRKDHKTDPVEYNAPWNYPQSSRELHNIELQNEPGPSPAAFTTGGPYRLNSPPDILFNGLQADPGLRDRFEASATPGDTDLVGLEVTPTQHLGDSVGFGQYLIWLETRDPEQAGGVKVPVVEWNLDADMGYAYHCWDWNRKSDASGIDPENFKFPEPCTFPEQANHDLFGTNLPDGWNWPDNGTRLKVHWVGPDLTDPGCDKLDLAGIKPLRKAEKQTRKKVANRKAKRRLA